ncbi:hypothetical protein HHI36_005663 [Cryptolaemus montrouzieri]|uniref:Endosome-associated-trafficking regulator 1 n=1 Tax=Cryptolaemus montrouzieri TaxID=559131 RepID=A0ABD2NV25_9CUCU
MESSENKKTLQLGNELLQQKIACHEMENRLKLAEENLKLATTKKNLNLKIESSKEIHQFSKSANASNMINLLNNLYCKVSSNFLQMKDGTRNCSDAENEIHTLFHLIFSEIK